MGKKAAGILVMVGAFLVAGVWGTYASIIPDFFKSHPIGLLLIGMLGIVLITVPSFYLLLTYLSERKVTTIPASPLNAIAKPIQDMQIELIEHGEFSSELILECFNRGVPVTLTANLRVIGASPKLAHKRIGYKGEWIKPVSLAHNRIGVEYASKASAYVATGDSGKLRIATIDAPQKPEGAAYMFLAGTDERAVWDLEHTPTTDLPYFIVSVDIRAKGHDHVLRKTYKVGPPHKNESLRMMEYSA